MSHTRVRGFTLIEVMIVVVIISILATLAIPAYSDYVTRSKIQEATSQLLAMRVKMEQAFQDNRSYNPAGVAAPLCPIANPSLKYFTITCPSATLSAYTIQATGGVAAGDQSMAGFTYTINEANTRASAIAAPATSKWIATNAGCWISRTGGQC
jgi:type IV pilus assembly protein PilE